MVYREMIVFCIITYLATLLFNCLLVSGKFLFDYLPALSDFMDRQSCHLQRKAVLYLSFLFFFFLYLSFLIYISFFFLYLIITLARTNCTMLKGSGKMGLPCFAPGLSGKASSFLPLRRMFIVSFANLPLTYLKLFILILKNKSTQLSLP